MKTPRATILGSAGPSVLVRCACRRKSCFSRAEWGRVGFAACPGCGAAICHRTLAVYARATPGGCLMDDRDRQELEELRAAERALREFVEFMEGRPSWHFAPQTLALAERVRPHLARLDGLRARREAPTAD